MLQTPGALLQKRVIDYNHLPDNNMNDFENMKDFTHPPEIFE